MQYLNDPHPWTEGVSGELSIVDLISNGTIPASTAAMLWWAIERGASVLTAGGPSGAGKSTLANACLGFLPNGAGAYAVAGRDDPMLVPSFAGPTYLLVSELSSHGRPFYISGEAARRVFALVRNGLRIFGTLHADSVAEALEVLDTEVELSAEDIARVDILAVTRVEGELGFSGGAPRGRIQPGVAVRRRIVEVGLLEPDPAGNIAPVALASWDSASQRLVTAEAPAGVGALARWAGVTASSAAAEIAKRASVLASLAAEGRRDPGDVETAVRTLRSR